MTRPHVLIISPALAEANNGNWQTAWRWSRLLQPAFRATIASQWRGEGADLMLALHARKSALSALAWAQAKGANKLAVVLTGTDLYRDIQTDPTAQRTLHCAGRLVVLQERAPDALPREYRHKAQVIFQSAPRRATFVKSDRRVRALMVGHLRDEKDPLTYLRAAARLASRRDIYLDHIGAALEPALGQAAQHAADHCPQYRWLGAGLAHRRQCWHARAGLCGVFCFGR